MRDKLSDKVGQEITIFGLFGGVFPLYSDVVFGEYIKNNTEKRTLLLKDVIGESGDYITDHLFIPIPEGIEVPKTLNLTNHVTVIGKVYKYRKLDKDYCNAKKTIDYGVGMRKLISGKVKKKVKTGDNNEKPKE